MTQIIKFKGLNILDSTACQFLDDPQSPFFVIVVHESHFISLSNCQAFFKKKKNLQIQLKNKNKMLCNDCSINSTFSRCCYVYPLYVTVMFCVVFPVTFCPNSSSLLVAIITN